MNDGKREREEREREKKEKKGYEKMAKWVEVFISVTDYQRVGINCRVVLGQNWRINEGGMKRAMI